MDDNAPALFPPPNGPPLVIAHRGGSLEAPENTVAGVRHGIACGSHWQEVDVALTRDGQPVLLHDPTFKRTTGGPGALADLTWAEVIALRAGAPQWSAAQTLRLAALGVTPPDFGTRYAQEGVPSLQQVLALPGAQLMLELKTTSKPAVLAAAVVEAVYAANMQHRVVVGSFDLATVQAVAAVGPQLRRLGIVEEVDKVAPFVALGVVGLAADKAILAEVRHMVPKHTAVWTWTIYTEDAALRAAAAGAHGLITDIPQRVVALFSRQQQKF